MNIYFSYIIILLFNYIIGIYAENAYYIVTILRKKSDNNYDDESQEIQQKIDELVNDRMNDIYNVIEDNKESYKSRNGKQDKKLNELNTAPLKKRQNKKKTKYFFVNKRNKNHFKRFIELSNLNNTEIDTEYIPFESKLVNYICPISNYYAINVYLSEETAKIVRNLKNVKSCEKSTSLKYDNSVDKLHNKRANAYYDINSIQRETNWPEVSVQDFTYTPNHLSLLSQSPSSQQSFDNNYYYSSTAGHGIDIYFLDEGIIIDPKNYDTYEGTPYERTVTCDAIADIEELHEMKTEEEKRNCVADDIDYPEHGIAVSSVAGGTVVGVAKNANIHMMVTYNSNISVLRSLDYILLKANPHKTVINISLSGKTYFKIEEDKLNDLIDKGFIITVSAGNNHKNYCGDKFSKNFMSYMGYRKAIAVGATDSAVYDGHYRRAEYSNFGDCIDIFAPGDVTIPDLRENTNLNSYTSVRGTSFAAPIVAGVAASIMAEHPDIEFTNELMRQTLNEMSIKDAIDNIGSSDTPNRFINNGKRSVYSPDNTTCDINNPCSDGCCSKEGKCVRIQNDIENKCLIENGCQSDSGFCTTKTKSINECQNEIKENKECQVDFTDFDKMSKKNKINGCKIFRSDKCQTFYKNQSQNSSKSICTIAKKHKSFGFINTFNTEVFDQYTSKCDSLIKENKYECMEYLDSKYERCSLEYVSLDELSEYNKDSLIEKCLFIQSEECHYFYNNIQDIINENSSCTFLRDEFSLDIFKELELSNSFKSYAKFNDNCNKLLNNIEDECNKELEKNKECFIDFNSKMSVDDIVNKCTIFKAKKCEDLFYSLDPIPVCTYAHNSEYASIVKKLGKINNNYKSNCNNNKNKTFKKNIINNCKKEMQTISECLFDHYPGMSNNELNEKCATLKNKKCKKYFDEPINDIPVCTLVNNYDEELFGKYLDMIMKSSDQSFDNYRLCHMDKETVIKDCEDKIKKEKISSCLLNGHPSNDVDFQYQCFKFLNADCLEFYEEPYIRLPECRSAQSYKQFNIFTVNDPQYKFYFDNCYSVVGIPSATTTTTTTSKSAAMKTTYTITTTTTKKSSQKPTTTTKKSSQKPTTTTTKKSSQKPTTTTITKKSSQKPTTTTTKKTNKTTTTKSSQKPITTTTTKKTNKTTTTKSSQKPITTTTTKKTNKTTTTKSSHKPVTTTTTKKTNKTTTTKSSQKPITTTTKKTNKTTTTKKTNKTTTTKSSRKPVTTTTKKTNKTTTTKSSRKPVTTTTKKTNKTTTRSLQKASVKNVNKSITTTTIASISTFTPTSLDNKINKKVITITKISTTTLKNYKTVIIKKLIKKRIKNNN
ncbi:hypothetical protein BCR32DRAFT_328936 [Anaeromyces robustus]|uniref:Peptidase S8/S53 domain-containing protein n=1 Tax=Anaeromyces robustus TaxID=1754192 RepID=A0A1Y1WV07_9FUNG|nr:hypothetical protein BCR32DRAFT_328936 [Anaeromyces robustus]|eukprot:ORX77387.1 hypothetical protein BCR32DRAFT_328936 [Anaeromyces robustus]